MTRVLRYRHPSFYLQFCRDPIMSNIQESKLIVRRKATVAAVGGDGAWRARFRFLIRLTADASCGASAGLPISTVWSSTIPSSLSVTWALWPNSDRLTQTALGDRPRIAVVQADPPSGAVGDLPGHPVPGLRGDLAGRGHQLGQVVDRTHEPATPPASGRIMHTASAQFGGVGIAGLGGN
jgi:hypothetical protein